MAAAAAAATTYLQNWSKNFFRNFSPEKMTFKKSFLCKYSKNIPKCIGHECSQRQRDQNLASPQKMLQNHMKILKTKTAPRYNSFRCNRERAESASRAEAMILRRLAGRVVGRSVGGQVTGRMRVRWVSNGSNRRR